MNTITYKDIKEITMGAIDRLTNEYEMLKTFPIRNGYIAADVDLGLGIHYKEDKPFAFVINESIEHVIHDDYHSAFKAQGLYKRTPPSNRNNIQVLNISSYVEERMAFIEKAIARLEKRLKLKPLRKRAS